MEREGGRGRLANLCCKLESPGELEKVVPAGPTPRDLIFMICRCSQLSRGFQLHPGPREPLLGRKKGEESKGRVGEWVEPLSSGLAFWFWMLLPNIFLPIALYSCGCVKSTNLLCLNIPNNCFIFFFFFEPGFGMLSIYPQTTTFFMKVAWVSLSANRKKIREIPSDDAYLI